MARAETILGALVSVPAVPGPFACILVPYDGSEPAQSALTLALHIATATTKLVLVTIVDEAAVISQSATSVMAYDPTPLLEALESRGKAVLAEAAGRAQRANVPVVTELVHDSALGGILATIEKYDADIVVMGTHARTGLSRLFMGSTTEGVLRATSVAVLTVRCTDAEARHPFATILLGIDDSDASDGAAALAALLVESFGAHVIACSAVDLTAVYESEGAYPFDAEQLITELNADAEASVALALKRASFTAGSVPVCVVDGAAAAVLLETAQTKNATAIMLGSHGRRGLRRFFLGSVAADVVRAGTVPVLVVRENI
jgi:nucleotide-binding universal stress UspA family protein